MSFLVLCLPRSRSAWLAHYLSYPLARPPQPVGHDILIECDSVDKFLGSYTNGMCGTVETGGSMLWRIVRQEMPDCKIVLVRRPLVEVHRSLAKQGVLEDLSALAEADAMLDAAETDPKILSIPYVGLGDPRVGQHLFEYLLELEFDFEWWSMCNATNIQVDMAYWLNRQKDRIEWRDSFLKDVERRSAQIGAAHLH